MELQKETPTHITSRDLVEEYSRSATLTVFEIHRSSGTIIPSYLLANMMSPALWEWREERPMHDDKGNLRAVNRRLKDLQRQFHWYTFTNVADRPGGDFWGLLNFDEEEARLGKDFIQNIRTEYHETLSQLLALDENSQFGQIILQDFYQEGFFPRLKNETIEGMNGFRRITHDKKGSGKCVALAMLWASSLAVCGRFPLDQIVIVANRAHLFVFIDDGKSTHLFNNGKWYNKARINNQSELANQAKTVATGSDVMFIYIPGKGMCDVFTDKVSEVDRETIESVAERCGNFLGAPLQLGDLDEVEFRDTNTSRLPDPNLYDDAEEYRRVIFELAAQDDDSVFHHAKYAYRDWSQSNPRVYTLAADRDYEVGKLAESINHLDEAIKVVKEVEKDDSVFLSRDRVAMPDEVLLFKAGDDRDRALLLYSLLNKSKLPSDRLMIGYGDEKSYVHFLDRWIDVMTFEMHSAQPDDLVVLFNLEGSWAPEDSPLKKGTGKRTVEFYEPKDSVIMGGAKGREEMLSSARKKVELAETASAAGNEEL